MNFVFLLLVPSFSYNVYRGDCVAILDKYKYDLTRFNGMEAYTPETKSAKYYVRICPENFTGPTKDVFVMQLPTNQSLRYIITQNALDYKPRNPNNFSEGLIYHADSEPFSNDGGVTYRTLDLEFDLICDPSITASSIDLKFDIDDISTTGSIFARGSTAAACPTIVPSPTPTPSYEPDCTYIDRVDDDTTTGIKGDLAKLNDGPFGVKTNIKIDGVDKVLFFQTCERMMCPPTYECGTEESSYSSAWLCDNDKYSRKCVSYGVGDDEVDFHPIDSSHLNHGMLLRLKNPKTSKKVNFTLTCTSTYPEGHIDWPDTGSIVDSDTLVFSGSAREVCLRPIPTSTPQPAGVCQFIAFDGDDRSINISLENINHGSTGWEKEVTVIGYRDHPKSRLMYQPCGAMFCPPGKYCDGDEDANLWLCYTTTDKVEQCIGYGLFKNNVTIGLFNKADINSGLQAKYFGDMKRTSDVIFNCDESLAENEIRLPSTVTLNGKSLSVFASSKIACPRSTGGGGGDHSRHAKITGGAVFLIVLAIAVILYLVIGVVIGYMKEGALHMPNATFWTEVWLCIKASFSFIFSCGKTTEIALESKYDKI